MIESHAYIGLSPRAVCFDKSVEARSFHDTCSLPYHKPAGSEIIW